MQNMKHIQKWMHTHTCIHGYRCTGEYSVVSDCINCPVANVGACHKAAYIFHYAVFHLAIQYLICRLPILQLYWLLSCSRFFYYTQTQTIACTEYTSIMMPNRRSYALFVKTKFKKIFKNTGAGSWDFWSLFGGGHWNSYWVQRGFFSLKRKWSW